MCTRQNRYIHEMLIKKHFRLSSSVKSYFMHICSPRQILSLLIQYCWHLFRDAVHDSWPPATFPKSTVLTVSFQRSHQKTVIKDQNWEWPESGLHWGKLIYLYSVSAGLNTPCFSSHSHFTQSPLSLLSKHSCFFCTSQWLQIFFHLPWWDCEKDSSTYIKDAKKKSYSVCESFRHSVSYEPDTQTASKTHSRSSEGTVSAHITVYPCNAPNIPSDNERH